MSFRISSDGSLKDIEEILDHIREYNRARSESSDSVPIGVFLEDEAGKKLAGLTGETYGNWLCIKFLWVDEKLRGQGTGTAIMAAAEKEARERGCKYAFVDTFDFQAPAFYRKLGYTEVFALTKYPYTGARYYYTKALR